MDMECLYDVTEQFDLTSVLLSNLCDKCSGLYSRVSQFKLLSGHSILKVYVVYLSPSRMPVYNFTLRPRPILFVFFPLHYSLLTIIELLTASLNKLQTNIIPGFKA
jgi:hypothetical protein